jgi:hypothetical protein
MVSTTGDATHCLTQMQLIHHQGLGPCFILLLPLLLLLGVAWGGVHT